METYHRRWVAALLVIAAFGAILIGRASSETVNDFHFSILGDRTGGAQPQIYGRVWREIAMLHPDFVISVGDTIEGQRDEEAEAEWQQVQGVWQRYRRFPLYLTPGNHDVWSPRSEQLYERFSGRPPTYSFSYQNAHFTVLDNSRTAELSEEQLDFLEKDLEQNKARSPKFVFFHKPFWIVPVGLKNREFRLHQIARKHGVNHVIAGHGHQFVRLELDGIVYTEVGSSGGTMIRAWVQGHGFRDGRFYHHVWAVVKGDQVRMTVKELDGPFGQGRMFDATEWTMNGPQFTPDDPGLTAKPET